MSLIHLTPTQLRRAAQVKEQIAKLQAELNKLSGVAPVKTAKLVAKPARRKISAAGIARIRAAQKARWAKVKAARK